MAKKENVKYLPVASFRTLLVSVCFLWGVGTFPQQDTSWKKFIIDSNMTAWLPINAIEIDTTLKTIDGLRGVVLIYKATTEHATLGITVSTLRSARKQSRREIYREVESGFRQEARRSGYSCNFKDTTIDYISGRRVVVRSNGSVPMPIVTIGYFFFIKNTLYSLVFTPTAAGAGNDIRKLLTGCHFTVDQSDIEPAKPEKKYTGVSNRDLLISLGVTILIVALLVVKFNRKSKKPKLITEYKKRL